MPVVGFLRSTAMAPFRRHWRVALRAGLKEAGFVEGQNVAIEYRYADDQSDRLPALAASLIRRPVAVIVAQQQRAALAAKAATTTVPIVFAAGTDPVADGLVASLNRPGGNVTGVTFLSGVLGAKRLELLRQFVPKATVDCRAGQSRHSPTRRHVREIAGRGAALAQGSSPVLDVSSDRDIEAAFADARVSAGPARCSSAPAPFLIVAREQIVALAARHALPAIYRSARVRRRPAA